MSAQQTTNSKIQKEDRFQVLGYITFCFSSVVFMKLPVLENAASGSVQLENDPSAIQTRVTSIKVIYYGYLII